MRPGLRQGTQPEAEEGRRWVDRSVGFVTCRESPCLLRRRDARPAGPLRPPRRVVRRRLGDRQPDHVRLRPPRYRLGSAPQASRQRGRSPPRHARGGARRIVDPACVSASSIGDSTASVLHAAVRRRCGGSVCSLGRLATLVSSSSWHRRRARRLRLRLASNQSRMTIVPMMRATYTTSRGTASTLLGEPCGVRGYMRAIVSARTWKRHSCHCRYRGSRNRRRGAGPTPRARARRRWRDHRCADPLIACGGSATPPPRYTLGVMPVTRRNIVVK